MLSLCSIQKSIFLELHVFKKTRILTIYTYFLKNEVFIIFELFHFLKKSWGKNVKALNFVAAILDFLRPSWIDNGTFITLYSIAYMVPIIYTNFGTFITKWTINASVVIILPYGTFIMQTGSSYLRSVPLILDQFLKELVRICKIHSRTIFVLCVVFKCQYYWSYSRKTDCLPFIYIFQMSVTHSNIVRLTRFLFLQVQEIPIQFLCSLSPVAF